MREAWPPAPGPPAQPHLVMVLSICSSALVAVRLMASSSEPSARLKTMRTWASEEGGETNCRPAASKPLAATSADESSGHTTRFRS